MITTINVSLPTQLKNQAQQLIDDGYYASFSDAVRTALRQLVNQAQLEQLSQTAKHEYQTGKTKALKNAADINEFFDKLD